MERFKLVSGYQPKGDQPQAIEELVNGLQAGEKYQTLLGVTGSGKTFSIANVIKEINKPTLVLSHNKTLAAQLYGEFRQLFPENAVEFFISYYDYYQPEAYIPGKDIYIEKDSDINSQIEKLRLHATMSLSERNDVIIVASVSCIYGLGIPENYRESLVRIKVGDIMDRDELLKQLVAIHYGRNDVAFERGAFRVNGDIVDIYPAYLENSIRVEFFGDEIEKISRINPLDNHVLEVVQEYPIYPANHFITDKHSLQRAIKTIKAELKERIEYFEKNGQLLEAQRIEQRTNFDLEMLRELGFCSGIENYSRHLTGAKKGDPPYCLLDYFPDDFLMVIDESHVSIPQVHAMYGGDYTRKKNLVDFGFRLPSAFDNRPLKFHEFEEKQNQVIYVSATPADYELQKSEGVFVEQIIRPTGLLDPEIEVKPVGSQVDDLLEQIRIRVPNKEKILVTTLTKRMAEDLSEYLKKAGVRTRYMHSEVQTIERSKIIRDFRIDKFDVLVGINLLREGLDLPEVSLVAIFDADKAGFLRSARSLIQTAGRAARHIAGKVIFYADNITPAMQETIEETKRRRIKQKSYNLEHGISPQSIKKNIDDIMAATSVADGYQKADKEEKKSSRDNFMEYLELDSKEKIIKLLEKEMMEASKKLEFEKAAELRDRIFELQEL
ncbi:MAG: excinuclease ABC subunit B [Candidatus Cloacimonadota bacterium]|nr:MAG: excinuclease ABC subunit B [Candidatus Cloacimonadota bacterium]RLC53982.1 MAG: excinuclease ABC subunit B [Candidatus Cloacimonadota bacterium]